MLAPLSKRAGLVPSYETGLFSASNDYRVPDQLYCRPEHQSERGAEGAELVVEIRSQGDETYDKIGFYAGLGVREMLIVHPPDRRVELLRAVGGILLPVTADTQGAVCSEVLGALFSTVAGRLRITWEDGAAGRRSRGDRGTLDVLGTPGLPGALDAAAAEIDAGDWVGAEKAAAAIVEFALGPLREYPRRVGKPLRGEQTGRWSARRGPYRLIYEIDEENRILRVLHAEHRSDVYRPQ